MGLFSAIGNAFKSIVKSPALAELGKSICNTLKPTNLINTATSFLPQPIGSIAGSVLSLVTGDGAEGEPKREKLMVKTKELANLANTHKNVIMNQIDKKRKQADAIRNQRLNALASLKQRISEGYLSQITISGDRLFTAITVVMTSKFAQWGWLKPINQIEVDPNNNLVTNYVTNNFSEIFLVGNLNKTELAIAGAVAFKFESDFRQFFETQGISGLATAITIMQQLQTFTENIDNPLDFFNFWGYNGNDVVNPLASIPTAIIDGLLIRISRHKITKAMNQWFAAASLYEGILSSYRQITADWLGQEATDMPVFMIDMLSFWILKKWGKDILLFLYQKYITKEMSSIITVEMLNDMHIYDIVNQLKYLLVSAKASWEIYHSQLPLQPTQVEECAMMINHYHLVVISWLLQQAETIAAMSGFGLDQGDIQDIYTSFTSQDDLVADLLILCNSDNADILNIDDFQITEGIVNAQFANAAITLIDDALEIDVTSINEFINDNASLINQNIQDLQILQIAFDNINRIIVQLSESITTETDPLTKAKLDNLKGKLTLQADTISTQIKVIAG